MQTTWPVSLIQLSLEPGESQVLSEGGGEEGKPRQF
jgi:hypothetical protein